MKGTRFNQACTRQRGLTLIELMVTLAVAIALMAVGIPMYSGVVANNRVVTQTNQLVSALNLARSEAVKQGATVSVAPAVGGWNKGWKVSLGSTEIRRWGPFDRELLITTLVSTVEFGRDGAAAAAAEFEISRTGSTSSTARCVTTLESGVIRSERGACP